MDRAIFQFLSETAQRAHVCKELGTCLECGQPAIPKCYSDAGRREYRISGYCEECFDNLFKGSDDDE
jgi:hypothetical protein